MTSAVPFSAAEKRGVNPFDLSASAFTFLNKISALKKHILLGYVVVDIHVNIL